MLSVGEGPEYRPFRDLRSVPQAGRPREQFENRRRVLFLRTAELGFFHFLEIVWLVPSVGQKIPVEPGWYVPSTTEDRAC
jgi:hypothetical protein